MSRRTVLVAVKSVDDIAVRSVDYAERIPAAIHEAVHAGGTDDFDRWSEEVPDLALEVVGGADVAETLAETVRIKLDSRSVQEVVLVLARRRPFDADGTTLRAIVRRCGLIRGAVPIVLPPPGWSRP